MHLRRTVSRMMLVHLLVLLILPKESPSQLINEEYEQGDEEDSSEVVWQLQQLVKCTLGLESIEELLAKFNCTKCQRCFKEWNVGYYKLNVNPICEEYAGQLYVLQYDYQCVRPGQARCVKTPDRCPYETCKLDMKFVACLKSMNMKKIVTK